MFPKINAIFRNKGNIEYPNFETPKIDNSVLINNPSININKLLVRNDSYIIVNPADKANCLAKHFANINNKDRISASPLLERIINKQYNEFKEKIASETRTGKTVVVFDNINVVTTPTYGDDPDFFCYTI